jgi:hypothetical protein
VEAGNLHFRREAPPGMTNAQFIAFIVETNATYHAGSYRGLFGPNSNSAAEFPFTRLPGMEQLHLDPVTVPSLQHWYTHPYPPGN